MKCAPSVAPEQFPSFIENKTGLKLPLATLISTAAIQAYANSI